MGVDFIGLLLAVVIAITASVLTVFVLSLAWPSLGLLALPLAAAVALLVLTLGAIMHALLVSNHRS
jgi:hypothetical protein